MKINNRHIIAFFLLLSSSSYADEFEDEFSTSATSGNSGSFTDDSIKFSGFIDFEQGANITNQGPTQSKEDERDYVLANRRLRLKTNKSYGKSSMYFTLDFNHDEILNSSNVDIREARFVFSPIENTDVSIGRQVSTWGVGDLIFINDLFPKNWVAHFQGREMDMLKDPTDSLRLTYYGSSWSFDVVGTPKFTPDTTPNGCRFAVFSPNSKQVSMNENCDGHSLYAKDQSKLENGELAASIKKKFGSQEFAVYAYKGFYKSPKGINIVSNGNDNMLVPFYPELSVYGASHEGQIGPGIFTAEYGYYLSRQDKDGENFLIENSMMKYLVGYRVEFNSHIYAGIQWYQEKMLDYDKYEESYLAFNPQGYAYRLKEHRNTYTARVGFKFMQDTLMLNFFSYIRPEDKDAFHKFEISKRIENHIDVAMGVNTFEGDENYTDREFGMLQDQDNAFVRFKYIY